MIIFLFHYIISDKLHVMLNISYIAQNIRCFLYHVHIWYMSLENSWGWMNGWMQRNDANIHWCLWQLRVKMPFTKKEINKQKFSDHHPSGVICINACVLRSCWCQVATSPHKLPPRFLPTCMTSILNHKLTLLMIWIPGCWKYHRQ